VTQKKRYFPTLEGWRGLPLISVILYHGRIVFFQSDSLLTRLFAHGDNGADAYFAIGGFLICGLAETSMRGMAASVFGTS
jgi:peptidoglycan/LPS O-acetylase OafA/YrhL